MGQKILANMPVLALLLQIISPVFAAGAQSHGVQPPEDCAKQCKESGYNPAGWSNFPAVDYFRKCGWSPALFTYDFESQASPTVIRACLDSEDHEVASVQSVNSSITTQRRLCVPPPEFDVQVSRKPAKYPGNVIPGQVIGAALTARKYLLQASSENNFRVKDGIVIHVHWAEVVIGIYVGSELEITQVAVGPLEDFIQGVQKYGMGQTLQTQFCHRNNNGSVFGIIADTSSGMEALLSVNKAVRAWSTGQCAVHLEQVSLRPRNTSTTSHVPRKYSVRARRASNWTGVNPPKANTTFNIDPSEPLENDRLALYALNECIVTEVQPDDRCGILAERCQLDVNKFMSFNTKPNFCTSLMPGQRVCCSGGQLPDIRPKQQPNGDCVVHTIQKGEYCAMIAAKNGLTVDELESLNKGTWGWSGCSGTVFPNTKLCVSPGEPPFPAADPAATCGPTKPGTIKPLGSKSKDWGSLNECPLKTCCNIWGNCGTTEDFCIDKTLGPPGSSKGPNGCVSNCGFALKSNQQPPTQFRIVGYFEAYNRDRVCLHMDVNDIPRGKYTHIHFAFASITPDYKVDITKYQDQFDKFRFAKGYKRILAFGGWAFSTESKTAGIFRDAVRPSNRERFASSLANFIIQNDLDGIDFDWEYPGVPDMTWLPPSSSDEGPNYLELLRLMRSKLPQKSISLAAPASYWYLKAFPIEKISKVVDYIVYMTYDLHGQWDYNNRWSQTGCDKGNCLRSHVDLVETYNALAMITKAGVSSDKITVGITSYGRQFKMTDSNCASKDCTYVGPEAAGTPGRCTNESAYISNAEIKEIIEKNPSAKVVDTGGSSKQMTYDGNWVSYMDDNDKVARTKLWKSMNFGGVIEWAIDLNTFDYDDGPNVSKGSGGQIGSTEVSKGMRGGGVSKEQQTMADSCQEDDSWRQVECTTPGIANYEMDPWDKWDDVKGDAAWCGAVKNWKRLRDSKRNKHSFTDTIMAGYFKGRSPFRCEILQNQAETSCTSPEECLGPERSSAAVMQLLGRSLHNINSNFRSIYDGLNEASIHKQKALDAIKKTLIPKPDHSLEIFLNVLSLALGFGSASFFNGFVKPSAVAIGKAKDEAIVASNAAATAAERAAAKKSEEAMGIKADNFKDFSTILLNYGMNAAKDKTKSLAEKKAKTIQEKIDYLFEDTITEWQDSLTNMNAAMFSGDEASLQTLKRLLQNGNSIDRDPVPSRDVQRGATRFLVSVIVPEVWRMQGYYPVLLDTAFPCGTVGIGIHQWTDKRNVGAAEICLTNEGGIGRGGKPFEGGRQYQLWAVKGEWGGKCKPSAHAMACGLSQCDNYLTMLPGLGEIREPIHDWGDLSIFDLINNAKNGIDSIWHGNHKYTTADATNRDLMEKLVTDLKDNMDISKIPGVVNIPSCSWLDIKDNWKKGIKDDNKGSYPCPGF